MKGTFSQKIRPAIMFMLALSMTGSYFVSVVSMDHERGQETSMNMGLTGSCPSIFSQEQNDANGAGACLAYHLNLFEKMTEFHIEISALFALLAVLICGIAVSVFELRLSLLNARVWMRFKILLLDSIGVRYEQLVLWLSRLEKRDPASGFAAT